MQRGIKLIRTSHFPAFLLVPRKQGALCSARALFWKSEVLQGFRDFGD